MSEAIITLANSMEPYVPFMKGITLFLMGFVVGMIVGWRKERKTKNEMSIL